jgi:hypothetical protein
MRLHLKKNSVSQTHGKGSLISFLTHFGNDIIDCVRKMGMMTFKKEEGDAIDAKHLRDTILDAFCRQR